MDEAIRKRIFYSFVIIIGTSILYYIAVNNYLLFHTVAELYSIVIAVAFFLIAWNTRDYNPESNLLNLGIAYLFISILDLLHTLGFKGMAIFQSYDFYANQLWIIARYLESLTLFAFAFFSSREDRINYKFTFVAYLAFTIFFVYIIFFTTLFPPCFIRDEGQTQFKIISEYIIILILFIALVVYIVNHKKKKSHIFVLLSWSIALTILSEFMFTLYFNNYGFFNFIGHIIKIVSFYLIYKAIIETGLKNPFSLVFNDLKRNEMALVEANQTKDKFFSIIAHDIRNPVGAISQLAQYRLSNLEDTSKEELSEDLKLIVDSAESSLDLLNKLLLWAKSQTGRIENHPAKINLKALIDVEIKNLYSVWSEKEIIINNTIAEKTIAFADSDLISTIIRNLISNAIKFSPQHSEITVSSEKKNNKVVLKVSDKGIGMSEEFQQKLFKISEKVVRHGTKREIGSGLGLLMCKEFIDLIGEKIYVKSIENVGTSISFTLPVE